ncbi:hypothetical protein [Burkholderia pyrrocinia]|uniref:hypothetical protein n=1 Tax=Burkholderia TaxID=32008 RepID=UPI00050625C1|nr:hypothetical protein [Burkholderia pyrrocinia]KFL54381.1 hypothetical protein JM78_04580 [Burkholderia pyrrocinia]
MAQLSPAQAALIGASSGALNGYASSQGVGGPMMGGALGGASALAYSNPYSAAAMVAGQAVTSMLGGPDPNITSGANGYRNMVDSHLDGSAWTVSTGSSKASSVPTLTSAAQNVAQSALQTAMNPMVLVAAVLLVAVWREGR